MGGNLIWGVNLYFLFTCFPLALKCFQITLRERLWRDRERGPQLSLSAQCGLHAKTWSQNNLQWDCAHGFEMWQVYSEQQLRTAPFLFVSLKAKWAFHLSNTEVGSTHGTIAAVTGRGAIQGWAGIKKTQLKSYSGVRLRSGGYRWAGLGRWSRTGDQDRS